MNYELGHIYKIVCNLDNSFCYIGSTFLSLDKRWQAHKDNYKFKYGTISIHQYFDKYGIENLKITLIKSYKVVRVDKKDHKHLYAYELLHINKNKKTAVNLLLPFTPMIYLNVKESKKNYREKNKEKLAKKNKEYRENNKEKIKEKDKKYNKNNKDKIKEYNKKKYENNKDKIKEKFKCECGSEIRKYELSRHLKTKKHIKFIENKICNNAIMQ